jgi:hypothetical protein
MRAPTSASVDLGASFYSFLPGGPMERRWPMPGLGREGAIASDGFEFCTSRAFDVPVADTTGAGDAFAAGFLTSWTRLEKIEQALHLANAWLP